MKTSVRPTVRRRGNVLRLLWSTSWSRGTRKNVISQVLTQMLGSEKPYNSKYEIMEEAMSRLYGVEPSDDDSSDTIVVDLDED